MASQKQLRLRSVPVLSTNDPPARALDEAAVRSVESAYDSAWNCGDLESMVSLFADRAVVVDPSGVTSAGRDEIGRSLALLLEGRGRGSVHHSEIAAVHFVADHVALVDGEAVVDGLRSNDGEPLPPVRHRFTDVLVKGDHGWQILHVRAYVFMPPPIGSPGQETRNGKSGSA